uniref:DUF4214 domain-containing protein n=1 Tax=Massilia sp. W12 TaxID=3126507 RepID=UPI00403F0158
MPPPRQSGTGDALYQNVLHRAPDAGGLQYWLDLPGSRRASPARLFSDLSGSAENRAALSGMPHADFRFDHSYLSGSARAGATPREVCANPNTCRLKLRKGGKVR